LDQSTINQNRTSPVNRRAKAHQVPNDEREILDMFLHDHLILAEFLIVLLFAAVLTALTIALKDALEARRLAKRKHPLSAREAFEIADEQEGVTDSHTTMPRKNKHSDAGRCL
jgi:hypothetical protein